jgi:hypothetical protein
MFVCRRDGSSLHVKSQNKKPPSDGSIAPSPFARPRRTSASAPARHHESAQKPEHVTSNAHYVFEDKPTSRSRSSNWNERRASVPRTPNPHLQQLARPPEGGHPTTHRPAGHSRFIHHRRRPRPPTPREAEQTQTKQTKPAKTDSNTAP